LLVDSSPFSSLYLASELRVQTPLSLALSACYAGAHVAEFPLISYFSAVVIVVGLRVYVPPGMFVRPVTQKRSMLIREEMGDHQMEEDEAPEGLPQALLIC